MDVKTYFLYICVYISCVVGEYLNIPEGSPCFFNELNGICVSIYKCLSADFDINRKMNPPICGFDDKDPIICCTDCNLVNDTRNIIFNTNLGFLQLNGQKDHDQCISYIDQLPYECKGETTIVRRSTINEDKSCNNHVSSPISRGGEEAAKISPYPHMAMVGFGKEWQTAHWLCSGTVITHKFVLTAAHCGRHPQFGGANYFGVGLVHRSDTPGLWHRYKVIRILWHEGFKAPALYNDIALLEAGTPIIFSDTVMPACVTPPTRPLGTDLEELDDKAMFTSWGNLKPPGLDVLLNIPLEEFSEEECLKEYPPQIYLPEGYNHTTQMCFGRRDEVVDSCEGDTGGPVQSLSFCTSTILGITIAGRGCGASNRAGIYTRVSYYLPWIAKMVWPQSI